MQYTITGTIHGRLIELEGSTNLPDGVKVRICFEPVESSLHGDEAQIAVLESAGAWADADHLEFDRWSKTTCENRCLT